MGMLNGSMRAVLCVRVPGIFIPSLCGTQAGRGLGRGWRNNLVSKLNRHVREQAMKHLLLTTIAAVLLVGCGEEQYVKDDKLARTASQGKIKEVKKYLAAGANVDARRALHEATDRGHKEIAELLIAKGADVNAKDADGVTPLDFAKRHPEITDLLRKHGGKTGDELKAEGK